MKKRKIATGIATVAGICFAMSTACLAGSMNASESSIYSAASGTFDYQGVTYKAAPQYLAQLQEYLCRDDIDLTADQANSAISEMYASVEQGVVEGYILPIDGSAPPATATPTEPATPQTPATPQSPATPGTEAGQTPEQNTESTEQPADTETPQTGNTGSTGTTDTQTQAGNTTPATTTTPPATTGSTETEQKPSTDIGKTAGGDSVVTSNGIIYDEDTEAQEEKQETLSTRIAQEEAGAEVTYNKAENVITFKAADGETYTLPEDINADMFGGTINMFRIIGVLMCVITVICGVALFATGSMKFQKEKPENSSHKLRKKVRAIAGAILVVTLTVDVFGIGGALWARVSYFDDTRILNSLTDSGYYHSAYDEMMSNIHMVMKVSGCEENVCDEVLTYENFMLATKTQIQAALDGKTSTATFEEMKKDLVETLSATISPEAGEKLASAVLVMYQSGVKNVIGEVAYAVKDVFAEELSVTGILLAVCAVASVLLIMFSERYPHRGLRRIANGWIVAGVIVAVISAWLGIGKPYTTFYITPDYLYLFMVYLVEYSVKVLAVVAGASVAIGVLLHLSALGMKKRLKSE